MTKVTYLLYNFGLSQQQKKLTKNNGWIANLKYCVWLLQTDLRPMVENLPTALTLSDSMQKRASLCHLHASCIPLPKLKELSYPCLFLGIGPLKSISTSKLSQHRPLSLPFTYKLQSKHLYIIYPSSEF